MNIRLLGVFISFPASSKSTETDDTATFFVQVSSGTRFKWHHTIFGYPRSSVLIYFLDV